MELTQVLNFATEASPSAEVLIYAPIGRGIGNPVLLFEIRGFDRRPLSG